MKTLITSFGPFHDFGINPSSEVMELLMARIQKDGTPEHQYAFELLEVSWERVDQFIHTLPEGSFDFFIHLGVATGSPKMRIETTGRNASAGKDVSAAEPASNKINASGFDIVSPLPLGRFHEFAAEHEDVVLSNDAGSFLCNYIYYKSLRANGAKSQVLFIHIADSMNEPFAPGIERQADLVQEIIQIMHHQGEIAHA